MKIKNLESDRKQRIETLLILKILRWMKTEEMQTAFISLMENIRIILADQKIRCI